MSDVFYRVVGAVSLYGTSVLQGRNSPEVTGLYEPDTGSVQYLVVGPLTKKAAIIGAVWNFDPRSGRTEHSLCRNEILAHARKTEVAVVWILDTHPHADRFMAAADLREKIDAPQAIGEKVREIAALWRAIYNLPKAFDVEASFDRLFTHGDTLQIGSLPVRVMLSPGRCHEIPRRSWLARCSDGTIRARVDPSRSSARRGSLCRIAQGCRT
jgi:glyoxylase-like metal-dependent hydrolase (beta-lactamase superfamily II)